MHAAEEADVLEARRLPAQILAERPLAGDHEVGVAVVAEGLDQHVHALQLLEAADVEEVRPRSLPRWRAARGSGSSVRRKYGRCRIGAVNPRARCASIVKRLGERKRSTCLTERSSSPL